MRMMIGIGTPSSQRRIPRPMTMTFQVAASKSNSTAVAGKATAGTSSGSCQGEKINWRLFAPMAEQNRPIDVYTLDRASRSETGAHHVILDSHLSGHRIDRWRAGIWRRCGDICWNRKGSFRSLPGSVCRITRHPGPGRPRLIERCWRVRPAIPPGVAGRTRVLLKSSPEEMRRAWCGRAGRF